MHLGTLPATEACLAGGNGAVIPVDIAAARAVAIVRPLGETERLPLAQALGRVVAAAIRATLDLPPFDNSAMDGYAIRRECLAGDGPWTLPFAGRLAAGDAPGHAAADQAALRFFSSPDTRLVT